MLRERFNDLLEHRLIGRPMELMKLITKRKQDAPIKFLTNAYRPNEKCK